MRRYGWWLFWSLAALLLFFGNGQLWITDSVESNYALTAKEMVLSGDWISPQIYGNYWYDKPVFFTGLRRQALKFLALTNLPHAFSRCCSAWRGLGCWFMLPKNFTAKKLRSGAALF